MNFVDRLADSAEKWIFGHRGLLLTVFAALSLVMGVFAARLHVDAGFAKSLPRDHEFIQTFKEYQTEFGGANRVVIALVLREGDMFQPEFFRILKAVTDEVFFLPGVDRAQVQSIFTPNVRYIEVVEDGLQAGNVIPADFQPTPEGLARVKENIIKSGKIGQLVANDFSGAIISAQLLEVDPATRQRLDYMGVAELLETKIRDRFEAEAAQVGLPLGVHIIGFAKVMGDISDGAREVLLFFLVSFLITGGLVWAYSNSLKLAILPLACSGLGVVWQLGTVTALGYGIDPLSILVPFLVFAIGVSHGVQMVRSFRAEVFDGLSSYAAARSAFRQIFLPGAFALVTDTLGFVTILLIPIPIVQEMAITASAGVGVIIVTNLILLPVLLSYTRLPKGYNERIASRKAITDNFWKKLDTVTKPVPSVIIMVVSLGLGVFGYILSLRVEIGDLHAGVPELREDSRYNQDTAVITREFAIGVDILSVIVEAQPDSVIDYETMDLVSRFAWHMENVEGVQSVLTLPSIAKLVNAGWSEGNLKQRVLPRNSKALAQAVSPVETATGLLNPDGSRMPVIVFLQDHKFATINRVVAAAREFIAAHPREGVKFRLATGNVGVMAATNQVVDEAQYPILYWIFGAVIMLCLLSYRDWRATVCIVIPLGIVSLLSYAVMYYLEIGLKSSTLPVVSLGVGIGVDYGIYLFSRLQGYLKRGEYFEQAMQKTFQLTGSAVVFTGLTLAIGVGTWVFSDLKFQADMGILLTFMFVVNMLGAMVLLPAMARWFYRHHRSGDPTKYTQAPFVVGQQGDTAAPFLRSPPPPAEGRP